MSDSSIAETVETAKTEADVEAPVWDAFHRYVGASGHPSDFRMFATGYHAAEDALASRSTGTIVKTGEDQGRDPQGGGLSPFGPSQDVSAPHGASIPRAGVGDQKHVDYLESLVEDLRSDLHDALELKFYHKASFDALDSEHWRVVRERDALLAASVSDGRGEADETVGFNPKDDSAAPSGATPNLDLPRPATTQPVGEGVRRALDNSQSLLAMLYHLGPINTDAWRNEGIDQQLSDQITENRAYLATPTIAAETAPVRSEKLGELFQSVHQEWAFAEAFLARWEGLFKQSREDGYAETMTEALDTLRSCFGGTDPALQAAAPAPEPQAGSAGEGVDADVLSWLADLILRVIAKAERFGLDRVEMGGSIAKWRSIHAALSARSHPVAAHRGGMDREAIRAFFEAFDAEPENDCWDTESGEEEPGAQRFPSDWSWQAYHDRRNAALATLRDALAPPPSASPRSDLAARATGERESAGGVPEGWKLVPVKPTQAMWGAFRNADESYITFHEGYRAMLAAVVLPPQPADAVETEAQS